MEQGRTQVQRLFYFVGEAFPNNAGRLDQYGKGRYEKARAHHDRFIVLLDLAAEAATRDAAALAAAGWPAASTAALAALSTQLSTANTAQEMQKGTGVEDGQTYLGLQNTLYAFGQKLSLAAKTCFAEDFAKRQLFDLTPGNGPAPERHELSVEPGQTKAVAFALPLTDDVRLHLRLLDPEPGQRAEVGRVVAEGEAPAPAVVLSPAVFVLDVAAPDLGPKGQLLAVRNAGKGPVRVEIAVLE